MTARIYRPSKNAMQSGKMNTKRWILEFEPERKRSHDPLMGWISSSDMKSQVHLRFATKEDAIAYARQNDIKYELVEPKPVKKKIKSYSDVFAFRG